MISGRGFPQRLGMDSTAAHPAGFKTPDLRSLRADPPPRDRRDRLKQLPRHGRGGRRSKTLSPSGRARSTGPGRPGVGAGYLNTHISLSLYLSLSLSLYIYIYTHARAEGMIHKGNPRTAPVYSTRLPRSTYLEAWAYRMDTAVGQKYETLLPAAELGISPGNGVVRSTQAFHNCFCLTRRSLFGPDGMP